jgi:hypothetical protein
MIDIILLFVCFMCLGVYFLFIFLLALPLIILFIKYTVEDVQHILWKLKHNIDI